MISHPILLLSLLLATVAGTRWLEARFVWVQRISSALLCTLAGIVLSNTGLIPHASPVQGAVLELSVPYALVLLLVGSDLRQLRSAGGAMVVLFLVACAGAFVGGVVGGVAFTPLLGPETWKLGGAFAGAFAGGGVNFAAVGMGLETEPSLFAAAAVADNLSTVPYLLAQVAVVTAAGSAFRRRAEEGATRTSPAPDGVEEGSGPDVADLRRRWTEARVGLADLALLGAIPLAVLWMARQLTGVLPAVPEVLWLTTVALLLAWTPLAGRLRGIEMVSYLALHLFFLVLGAASSVAAVLTAGLPVLGLMLTVLGIQGAIVYGTGWLRRDELPTVSLAAQAAMGGPGSALALGMAMGWQARVVPAVLVGILGYAVGNYLGFACAWVIALLA